MSSLPQDPQSDTQTDIISDVGIDTLPILTTKLYRPPVTPDLEQRERLIEQLERNRQRPLTLISAPAGYGKTMLASQWLESCGYTYGWVSLDESDNDLPTFVSYLLAPIRNSFQPIQLKTRLLLDAPSTPSAHVLARYLLNDLNQVPEPFILVLDDIHRIHEQSIFDMLGEMLQHPNPNLHVVLIGRSDPSLPIASLRARGQLNEIRAQDLRFTVEETARLLQNMLQRQIDQATVADWAKKTEGWVTALRLAVLSLRHRGKEDDLSSLFQGDIRYLREYLLAEVLAHLPDVFQNWLLKTTLLERFCAPLCEAICQAGEDDETDSLTGEIFIDWLERENLFLIPLDDGGEWFRFHHLFQEFLLDIFKTQISAEQFAALQVRASDWFAENGLIDEALNFALDAGDIQSAAHLVKQHRYKLMNNDQWRRLERWIKLLPDQVVSQDVLLMITKAYIALHLGYDSEIFSSLRNAQQILADLPTATQEYQTAQSEIDVIDLVVKVIKGQLPDPIDLIERSLQQLPDQALQIRQLAFSIKGINFQMRGDLKTGVAVVRNALANISWPEGLQAKFMHFLSIIYMQGGDLNGVLASARTGLAISEKIHGAETISWCRYHLGISYYLRNEFSQAEPILLEFLEDRVTAAPNYLAQGCFMLALIYDWQGRTNHADQVIQILADQFREANFVLGLAYTEAFRVELALRRGNLAAARRLSENVNFEFRYPIWFPYTPQLTSIKLWLAEGTAESLAKARSRLDILDEAMGSINRLNVRIDVLALQAIVCDAQGDEDAGLKNLETALALAEVGGFIHSFAGLGAPMADLLTRLKGQGAGKEYAEYIDKILAAFPEEHHTSQGLELAGAQTASQPLGVPLIDPLTRRELQVLKLLATDLPMQDIAARLHISTGTLNSHTKNIYSKMSVHKRAQAVQRGKALSLI